MQKHTHPAIVAGRHLVGIAAVQALSLWGSGLWNAVDWLAHILVPAGIGAAVAGLLTLFFTRSQTKRFARNAAMFAWLAAGLLVIGDWQGHPLQGDVTAAVLATLAMAGVVRFALWINRRTPDSEAGGA